MMKTSPIGLNAEQSAELVAQLNQLLANYQIFYMNVRGFHWNVKGAQFFILHEKFEELYTNLLEKVDAIAERVLTLGGHPDHAFSTYLNTSDIKEVTQVSEGAACVQHTVEGYSTLIEQQRSILSLADDADDEGTLSLLSEYITEQEKQVWMLNAYLDA